MIRERLQPALHLRVVHNVVTCAFQSCHHLGCEKLFIVCNLPARLEDIVDFFQGQSELDS